MGDAETTIRERIKEIRKKFKGYQEEPIKTIWGVGYQWEKINNANVIDTKYFSNLLRIYCSNDIWHRDFFLVETGFILSPDVITQNVETVKIMLLMVR